MSDPTAAPTEPAAPEGAGPAHRLPFPQGFTDRGDRPFDPPELLTRYREKAVVHRVHLTNGDTGWLVTGNEEARVALTDRRFSSDRLRNPLVVALPPRLRAELMRDDAAGNFVAMDAPEHTRYRKLVARQFTPRRIRGLEPRIREVVTERLDAMTAAGTRGDLVRDFALAVPALAVCELLGVGHEHHEAFQARTETLLDPLAPVEEQLAVLDDLRRFIHEQVRRKRATRPTTCSPTSSTPSRSRR